MENIESGVSTEAVLASPCTQEGGEAALRPKTKLRKFAERGLTTVEYAIGLLAAATVALVLLRIFNDNQFFDTLMKWVTDVFTSFAAQDG